MGILGAHDGPVGHEPFTILKFTLQHATAHCKALQRTATHCNTLQHTAAHCNTLQHTATHCNTGVALGRISIIWAPTLCNTLQHTATHCNTLQHTATHCNTLQHRCRVEGIGKFWALTLQHTATHCNTLNTLQHIATQKSHWEDWYDLGTYALHDAAGIFLTGSL